MATKRAEIVDVDCVVTDAATGMTVQPTPPKISASKLPLDTLEGVRRELARVYREMRAGTLPSQQGTRLTYVLGEVGKLLALTRLESRIEALEGYAMPAQIEGNTHGDES